MKKIEIIREKQRASGLLPEALNRILANRANPRNLRRAWIPDFLPS
jgi:hypothetical protein